MMTIREWIILAACCLIVGLGFKYLPKIELNKKSTSPKPNDDYWCVEVDCDACKGTGKTPERECPLCRGAGVYPPGYPEFPEGKKCFGCFGKGRIPEDQCWACGGCGKLLEEHRGKR